MNREFAATLLDPDTSENLISALKKAGKTDIEIKMLMKEACTIAAMTLRMLDALEDDGK